MIAPSLQPVVNLPLSSPELLWPTNIPEVRLLHKERSKFALVLWKTESAANRAFVGKLDLRRRIEIGDGVLPRQDKGCTAVLQQYPARDQGPSAVIPLLIQLRLAEHADINLRRYLVGVFSPMLAIPPADGFDVSAKIREELLASRRDVLTVGAGVISPAKQHEMVELQQHLESFVAEEVEHFAGRPRRETRRPRSYSAVVRQ